MSSQWKPNSIGELEQEERRVRSVEGTYGLLALVVIVGTLLFRVIAEEFFPSWFVRTAGWLGAVGESPLAWVLASLLTVYPALTLFIFKLRGMGHNKDRSELVGHWRESNRLYREWVLHANPQDLRRAREEMDACINNLSAVSEARDLDGQISRAIRDQGLK
jgi:hypothetical protein